MDMVWRLDLLLFFVFCVPPDEASSDIALKRRHLLCHSHSLPMRRDSLRRTPQDFFESLNR
jgi:hypothetical protein